MSILDKIIPKKSTLIKKLTDSKLTSWLAPWLSEGKLWQISRRSIALGMAIGVFFAFLIPIAQIPFAAGASILLRANMPAAITSTLVTNPITFPPIYYMAYKTGLIITRETKTNQEIKQDLKAILEKSENENTIKKIQKTGKPLIIGLISFSILGSLITYITVSITWRIIIWLKIKRRQKIAPQK